MGRLRSRVFETEATQGRGRATASCTRWPRGDLFHSAHRTGDIPMNARTLALLLLLTGCGGSVRGSSGVTPGPVRWPPGRYLASTQLAINSGAMRAGSTARRQVQAEVWIDPDGTMTLASGEGSCQEHATDRADVRDFRCGEAAFHFVLYGEAIRGTASAPVTFWVSGWSRCTGWATDASGRQTCVRYEEHPDEERTARASGSLSVVAVGG